jgi:hypothetical protein
VDGEVWFERGVRSWPDSVDLGDAVSRQLPQVHWSCCERLSRASPCPIGSCCSVRLNARELDHLGPLFSVFGDELAEIDRRA